jgi:hypothetical protein
VLHQWKCVIDKLGLRVEITIRKLIPYYHAAGIYTIVTGFPSFSLKVFHMKGIEVEF